MNPTHLEYSYYFILQSISKHLGMSYDLMEKMDQGHKTHKVMKTLARQAPLFMGFFWQKYWSGLPFLLQGIFLTQGSEAPASQADSLPLNHQGSPS